MRILVIRSNPVDPDSRVEKEANSLIKHGHEVEIVGWDRSSNYFIQESNLNLQNGKVKIFRFGISATFGGGIKRNLFPLLKFQWRLYKWLSKNIINYDAIHACDFDTAYISYKIAKKNKKIFTYDIFDFYVDSFNVPYFLRNTIKSMDFNIIKGADTTIICSEKRKEQIDGSSPKNLVIIHNTPPEIDFNNERLELNSSKIKIVYVGILANGRCIKEIAEIVRNDSRFEFHVGGFGKLESYFEKLSNEYNNIFYYGKLPYNRTLELEDSCDIMTAIYNPEVSNHYYAAPNKFYEALMLGKPLIMAKNTGMSDVIEQHRIGEVIEYNIGSLESAIENLVKRKAEWPKISRKMKEIHNKDYSWNQMENRLIELYRELEN